MRLEPLDAAKHAPSLFALSQAPGTAGLWTYLFDAPMGDPEAFAAMIAARAASADPLFCAILDRATGKAVGMASLMRMDEKNRVIEVGNILFTPALQRQPGATEAMYLLMKHVFDDLGYRRYEWKCNDLNAPSKRAARRLGFEFEGVFRQHMFVKGRNRDTAWFAMLDRDWPARKAAFEGWLEASNFDAAGQQKRPLQAFLPGGKGEVFAGWMLRRGGLTDRASVEKLQADAYHRNQTLIGRVPLPLTWDYGDMLASAEIWLADGADGLAGVLMLTPREHDLYIDNISVAPREQGTGLGNVLLEFGAGRARHHGLTSLRLTTNSKLDHNIGWYQRKGYAIERREILADRTAVHLVRQI